MPLHVYGHPEWCHCAECRSLDEEYVREHLADCPPVEDDPVVEAEFATTPHRVCDTDFEADRQRELAEIRREQEPTYDFDPYLNRYRV